MRKDVMTKIKAVIDRFEGDNAVLLVGEDEQEYIVPRASLPSNAVQGLWLLVELEQDRVMNAVIDDEEMAKVKERLARFRRGKESPITRGSEFIL
jgi:hypothetical protein